MARPVGTSEDRKVKLLARLHTERAINALVKWLESDVPSASVAAAQALLDRGYGKPQQTVEATIEHVINVGESEALTPRLEQLRRLRSGNTVQ
jgi:HEAT repeat protein